jgi:hypothetical protein
VVHWLDWTPKSGSWSLSLMPVLGGAIYWLDKPRAGESLAGAVLALVAAVQNACSFRAVRPVTKMVAAAISLGSK